MISTHAVVHLLRLWLVLLLGAVVARVLLFTTYRVEGSSMVAALLDGDRILVGDVGWLAEPVENGDTVVLSVEDEVLVKRVIARPGDLIAMDEGAVIRNGAVVPEAIPSERNRRVSFPPTRMSSTEYFVMGDNRLVSIDSRDFGPVRAEQLIGKVFLRISGQGLQTVAALEREP